MEIIKHACSSLGITIERLLPNESRLYIGLNQENNCIMVKVYDLCDASSNRRFNRSVNASAVLESLPHCNIMRTIDVKEMGTLGIVVMPYYPGEDWHHYIVRINSSSEQNITLMLQQFLQMVKAVKHLHASGLVHLDIKPENFYRDNHGITRIIDFDLSILSFELPDIPRGSLPYMAPEMLVTGTYVFEYQPCDVFSLGMTLYTMLLSHNAFYPKTSENPKKTIYAFRRQFRRTGITGLMKLHKSQYLQAINRVQRNSQVMDILQGMLCIDPKDRWDIGRVHSAVSKYLKQHVSKNE